MKAQTSTDKKATITTKVASKTVTKPATKKILPTCELCASKADCPTADLNEVCDFFKASKKVKETLVKEAVKKAFENTPEPSKKAGSTTIEETVKNLIEAGKKATEAKKAEKKAKKEALDPAKVIEIVKVSAPAKKEIPVQKVNKELKAEYDKKMKEFEKGQEAWLASDLYWNNEEAKAQRELSKELNGLRKELNIPKPDVNDPETTTDNSRLCQGCWQNSKATVQINGLRLCPACYKAKYGDKAPDEVRISKARTKKEPTIQDLEDLAKRLNVRIKITPINDKLGK